MHNITKTMDPDKPVTNALVARGFGRDVMGLLLAHREEEVASRLQTLHLGKRKLTVAQTQQILDGIDVRMVKFCTKCREAHLDTFQTSIGCKWCNLYYCDNCTIGEICEKCMKIRGGMCSECGLYDCARVNKCWLCRAIICTNGVCSMCWWASHVLARNRLPPFDALSEDEEKLVRRVMDNMFARGYCPVTMLW